MSGHELRQQHGAFGVTRYRSRETFEFAGGDDVAGGDDGFRAVEILNDALFDNALIVATRPHGRSRLRRGRLRPLVWALP